MIAGADGCIIRERAMHRMQQGSKAGHPKSMRFSLSESLDYHVVRRWTIAWGGSRKTITHGQQHMEVSNAWGNLSITLSIRLATTMRCCRPPDSFSERPDESSEGPAAPAAACWTSTQGACAIDDHNRHHNATGRSNC